MTDTPARKRKRRMAREPQAKTPDTVARPVIAKTPSKLDIVEGLLRSETGASIAEMVEATGWQQHSVRSAMAEALKKRGLTVTSEKVDGMRRYRAEAPA